MQGFSCLGKDAKMKKELNLQEDRIALPVFAYRLHSRQLPPHNLPLLQRQKSSHYFLFIYIIIIIICY